MKVLRWSVAAGLAGTVIGNFALAVTSIGYLILYSDDVTDLISFQNFLPDISSQNIGFFLSSDTKLYCVFFGLWFLGTANLLLKAFQPQDVAKYQTEDAYVQASMNHFGPVAFDEMIKFFDLFCSGKHIDELSPPQRDLRIEQLTYRDNVAYEDRVGRLQWYNALSSDRNSTVKFAREIFGLKQLSKRSACAVTIVAALVGWGLVVLPNLDLLQSVTRFVYSRLMPDGISENNIIFLITLLVFGAIIDALLTARRYKFRWRRTRRPPMRFQLKAVLHIVKRTAVYVGIALILYLVKFGFK